jgi:hypothetical protein
MPISRKWMDEDQSKKLEANGDDIRKENESGGGK